MPETAQLDVTWGVPHRFFCEYSATKSRVLTLITNTQAARFTCSARVLAREIADMPNTTCRQGTGPAVDATLAGIATRLPDTAPRRVGRSTGLTACAGGWRTFWVRSRSNATASAASKPVGCGRGAPQRG